MRQKRIQSFFLAIILIAASLAGCGEAVTLTADGAPILLEIGGSAVMKVSVTPANIAVTYTSGDPSVATVDETGLITAVGAGETTITAQAKDQSVSVEVRVSEPVPEPMVAEKMELIVPYSLIELPVGDTAPLDVTATVGAEISYESDDENIASVDEDGFVTAIAPGIAEITVMSGGLRKIVTIAVPEPISAEPEETAHPETPPESSAASSSTASSSAASSSTASSSRASAASDPEAFFNGATINVSNWVASAVDVHTDGDDWVFLDKNGRELGRSWGTLDYTKGGYARGDQGMLDAFNDYREVPRAQRQKVQAAVDEDIGSNPFGGGGGDSSGFAREVVRLTNLEREAEGLSALSINESMMTGAQTRAREIVSNFSHTRPGGGSGATLALSYGTGGIGAENIAYGQTSPSEVVNGWMNSPGHRANILRSDITMIGVGCYEGSDGTLYWVQLFAG